MADGGKNDNKLQFGIEGFLNSFQKNLSSKLSETVIAGYVETVSNIGKYLADTIATSYMSSFKESFGDLLKAFEEARNDPNSVINFFDYQKKLNTFHWAWPYGIEPEELRKLLSEAEDEKQFDNLIASFFTKDRIDQMCNEIYKSLPRRHKVIFRQITRAIDNKQYALANNGLMSVIDNLLCLVLKNKGRVQRKGILKPLIDFYSDMYSMKDIGFVFFIYMLSNNVDLIFSDYDFDKKIIVDTNKKVRRHLSVHGFAFSNKKNDTIMLLNTLIAILSNQKYLLPFRETLIWDRNNKQFKISCKDYVIKRRIKNELAIE